MKRYTDAKCVAIVNGKRCGLTPSDHGVENRSKLRHALGLKLAGHSFMLAQNSGTAKIGETDASPST